MIVIFTISPYIGSQWEKWPLQITKTITGYLADSHKLCTAHGTPVHKEHLATSGETLVRLA